MWPASPAAGTRARPQRKPLVLPAFRPPLAAWFRPQHPRRSVQTDTGDGGRKRCWLKRGGLLPPRAVHSAPQRGSLQGLCWFSRRGSLFRRGGHFGDDFSGECPVFKRLTGFRSGITEKTPLVFTTRGVLPRRHDSTGTRPARHGGSASPAPEAVQFPADGLSCGADRYPPGAETVPQGSTDCSKSSSPPVMMA